MIDVRAACTLVIILVALLVGGGGAAAATQAPTFVKTEYPFIGNHVVGDFNGDGSLDLAGLGYLVQAIQVRLNNGAGTFGALADYPAPWGQDVVAGDFNGDGRLDLVVTHNDPQITFSLLTGNGNGTFNAAVSFPNTSGFDSPDVVAADLNNDAKLDLVVAHNANCFGSGCVIANTISVILGNGDGTFQPTREINVGRGTGHTAVGDFNRDGIKDLAIAGSSSQLYRLFGVGDGTFIQQPTLTLTADTFGVEGTDVDVADFNGDTIQDLVVAIGTNGSRTAILIGNGDGTFRPPLIITEPNINIPQYQAVADYNGDGFQDLALSLGDGNTGLMEILNGNGDGTFQPLVMYLPPPPTSVGGSSIVAADFNGDNKADIAIGRAGAFPGFLVLINSTGAAPPATPSAPTLLSPAQDATPAQPVAFDWTDVSAATSYRIQIDDSSDFSAPRVVDQTVTASHFTASTLAARQHWWRVRGINSAGTAGTWSSVRRFTPQGTASAPALSALSLSPTSVVGGNTSQGTATLTSAAPSGGAMVTLSSSNTSATVPASVTIAAGATSRTFTVSTVSVAASTTATITGAFGGVSRSATLSVTPPAAPAALSAVSVTPTSVTGGTSSQGRVTLTAAAPAGGFAVSLSSSNTAATVPASVSVAQGATSATFTISTSGVTTSTPVTINASAGSVTRTATLTLTPPGQAATLTVTATGRSGERVTSSPAGINVSVGSSGSASFATGTVITLSATNGRDVVWSGACSSGGNKTRSCTFTLGGTATVTANVQ
jgi:VCBS repeat protein